jgi:hypothetical protein
MVFISCTHQSLHDVPVMLRQFATSISKPKIVQNTLYHAFIHADLGRYFVRCTASKPKPFDSALSLRHSFSRSKITYRYIIALNGETLSSIK